MGTNILISFVAHMMILTISWLLMMPFTPYTDDRMNLEIQLYLVVVAIAIIALYVWIGTKLHLQTSRRQNWMTVMALAVPGLILWVAFTAIHGDLEWVLFFLYYQSMAPIGTLADIQTPSAQIFFNLIISLVPSILMGLGLEWKRRRIAAK